MSLFLKNTGFFSFLFFLLYFFLYLFLYLFIICLFVSMCVCICICVSMGICVPCVESRVQLAEVISRLPLCGHMALRSDLQGRCMCPCPVNISSAHPTFLIYHFIPFSNRLYYTFYNRSFLYLLVIDYSFLLLLAWIIKKCFIIWYLHNEEI